MKNFLFFISIMLVFPACEKVLEKPYTGAISPEIWDNAQASTLFINQLYDRCLPTFSANSGYSDESPGSNDYIYGTLTSSSVGDFSTSAPYPLIRDFNIAIEGLEEGSMNEAEKNPVLGQVYFLRAFQYWLLVRLYGGVPLITDVMDIYNDNLNIPRNRTSECINQIVDDLDKAAAMLPAFWSSSERGRITRGAALALKGRVLLFWASPQFNLEEKQERWQMAYEANRTAYDTCVSDDYALLARFANLFTDEGNEEFIFGRLYNYTADKTHTWENSCRPRSVGLNGGMENNPTWDLVQAFPMKNGLDIENASSGYDLEHYWLNRDPRFYATVAYNGMEWEFEGFEADRKQWHYYYLVVSTAGDTSVKCVETPTTTRTGFYCNKAINTTIPADQARQAGTDWIEIRLAEVMLNLAECANEIDHRDEAYAMLTAIRARAGITAGANSLYGLQEGMDKLAMRSAIMLERRIELAFENKRYWDLRRRNCYSGGTGSVMQLNGTERQGLITILKQLPGLTLEQSVDTFQANYQDVINIDTDFETYFYTEEYTVETQGRVINFPQPYYNFYPIQPAVLDRSPAIKQTNGWDEGGFDPYAE